MLQPHHFQHIHRAQCAFTARLAGKLQSINHIGQCRTPQHHRTLKHHRLAATHINIARAVPDNAAGRRFQQAVTQPHQHAFTRAVGAKNDRARPRFDFGGDAIDDRRAVDAKGQLIEFERQHVSHTSAGPLLE